MLKDTSITLRPVHETDLEKLYTFHVEIYTILHDEVIGV